MDTANRPLARPLDERTDEQLQLPAELAVVEEALRALPSRRPDAMVVDTVVAAAMYTDIRALYNENAADTLPAQVEAEAAQLASLVAALDHLPTRRPDAYAVDAVMGAAMHAGIRKLYGEEEVIPPSALELREAAQLSPLVTALDGLPTHRPNAESVAAIMTAAGGSVRTDRPLVRGKRRMPVWAGAVAAVLLIGFSTFWVITSSTFTDESILVAQVQEGASMPPVIAEIDEGPIRALPVDEDLLASAHPEATSSAARSETRPARSRSALRPVQTAAVTMEQAVEERSLADDSDALRAVYLRLDAMQNDDLAWDDPEFELGGESAPTPSAPNHGWMQVRVDR